MARFLEVVLGAAALALIAMILLLVLVVAYPRAGRLLTTRLFVSHPDAMLLASDVNVRMSTILERAHQGFEYRVARPFRRLARAEDSSSESSSGASAVLVNGSSCVQCHKDFADKLRFGDIYFDHRIHAGGKLTCDSCHEATGLARDTSPPMERCEPCHEQASETDCDVCHAPGTLFHGARLSADRGTAEKCSVCHPPSSLVRAEHRRIAVNAKDTCVRCHEQSFCDRCHPASHARRYASAHSREMRLRIVSPVRCWSCHEPGWCAMKCHSGTQTAARGVVRP